MDYLNKQQRDELDNRLRTMRFNRAKNTLYGMDPNVRLVYYRNIQKVGEWQTRIAMPNRGVVVTLVEHLTYKSGLLGMQKAEYTLADVVVQPSPDNRT